MEPNADGVGGIAEISSDTLPETPIVDDALAALVTNGHAEELNGHAEAIIVPHNRRRVHNKNDRFAFA